MKKYDVLLIKETLSIVTVEAESANEAATLSRANASKVEDNEAIMELTAVGYLHDDKLYKKDLEWLKKRREKGLSVTTISETREHYA